MAYPHPIQIEQKTARKQAQILPCLWTEHKDYKKNR